MGKRREGGILYIMMSLFVWEKICTIVSNVHLSWDFLFCCLISVNARALDNKLNDVWKNSRVESHTAVINNEMSTVLQNLENNVTLQKDDVFFLPDRENPL